MKQKIFSLKETTKILSKLKKRKKKNSFMPRGFRPFTYWSYKTF